MDVLIIPRNFILYNCIEFFEKREVFFYVCEKYIVYNWFSEVFHILGSYVF